MISVNLISNSERQDFHILLGNDSQGNITWHPELLHAIIYEPTKAHSFNGDSVQTIGNDFIFSLQIADRTIDLLILLLADTEQMAFLIILSDGYLQGTLHRSTYEHYFNERYLYGTDTQVKLKPLENLGNYLTIRLKSKALVHAITFQNVSSSDAPSNFCYFN